MQEYHREERQEIRGPRSALPQQYRAGMSAKRAINASASTGCKRI
jgi:hypothetical protein